MIKKIVTNILKECLAYRKGEVLFFFYDQTQKYLEEPLTSSAQELGIEIKSHKVLQTNWQKDNNDQPIFEFTNEQARDLCDSDIALIFFSEHIRKSKILTRCCQQLGLRGLLFRPVTEDYFIKLYSIDFSELSRVLFEVANLLSRTRTVKIKFKNGGELTFSIEDRLPHIDSGICTFPGLFSTQPAGKVFVAIREGTTDGTFYVDPTVIGLGKLDSTSRVIVENGIIKHTDNKILDDLIKKYDSSSIGFGEFGIGLNPNIETANDVSIDDKIFNNIYFVVGNNKHIGGIISSEIQVKFILGKCELYLDGKILNLNEIIRQKRRYASAIQDLTHKIDASQLSMYEVLFKRSNDPQYVLDLETQNFLEANESFLNLVGYSKEELLSGIIKAPDLIPPEDIDTYSKKKEIRKQVSSERYQIRIVTKSGERKLVEVSVQRISLNGKDILIGSLRDMTEAENMKALMRQQIRAQIDANLRIVALTEKLKNLPHFTPYVLTSVSEEDLFKKTAQMLCDKQGLSYTEASFYLIENNKIVLKYSTVIEQIPQDTIDLDSDHILAKIANLQKPPQEGEIKSILPIKGREKVLGLLEVSISEKEMELLKKNEPVKKSFFDVSKTLANIIGIVLENMRLYNTVRRQSITDQLTGVFNRRYLDGKITEEFKRARRYGRELCILLIDIDNFKPVNDNLGHTVGDFVLKEIANVFLRYSRDVDIVSRYGGDEFVIILPETNSKNAVRKGEILRRNIERLDFSKMLNVNYKFNVSISVGVCALTSKISSPEEIIKLADEACYTAKKKGKNRIVVANENS